MGFWKRLWARLFGPKRETESRPARTVIAPAVPVSNFGTAPDNPILCHDPSGERAYIARLRCGRGHRLGGARRGSMPGKCSAPAHHVSLLQMPGENPAEECIVDAYNLVCEGGEYSCVLYFDMYHPTAPPQPAPAGITIV